MLLLTSPKKRLHKKNRHKKHKHMLLLEVLLSMTIVAMLAVMLMSNLGFLVVRGQKEKGEFAYETQVQILDLTILKTLEELCVLLPTSSKGHLPICIEEYKGKKELVLYILHAQDSEEEFTGILKCRFIFDHGAVKLIQENEKQKTREVELVQAESIQWEFFDAETNRWTEYWIKEKETAPSLLRFTLKKKDEPLTLYYLTPFLKTPLPI